MIKPRWFSLRRPVVPALLAALAAFGGLTLALAEPPLSEQSAQFVEQNLGLLIALGGLVLVVGCGVAALAYGMRHQGGRQILRSFRNLVR